jgi:preprotein translocase SecF subunit
MITFLKQPNFSLVDRKPLRRVFFALSLVIILIGIISIVSQKGLRQGIDFAGGFLLELKFREEVPIGALREALSTVGLGESIIQKLEGENVVLFRMKKIAKAPEELSQTLQALFKEKLFRLTKKEMGTKLDLNAIDDERFLRQQLREILSDKGNIKEITQKILSLKSTAGGLFKDWTEITLREDILKKLKERFYLGPFILRRLESVGPAIGKQLQGDAILAVIFAMIGMLIYIGLRFEFKFALAADLALVHDIMVILTALSLTGRELSIPVIAAILALVGYSINDTIVLFDRIRENLKLYRGEEFKNVVNRSINETLNRTLVTSLTTFFAALAIFLLGGKILNDFAFILVVGVICGTYSSIFVASNVLVEWNERRSQRVKK